MTGSAGVPQEIFLGSKSSSIFDREPPVMSLESLCLKAIKLKMNIIAVTLDSSS